MAILSGFLLIMFIISSVLLVIIVLMQDEQGEGLGGIFGGGGAAPVGNRSGNILTSATAILATIFVVSVAGFAFVNRTPEAASIEAAARRLEIESEETLEWWTLDQPVQLPDAAANSPPTSIESAIPPAPAGLESLPDEETAQEAE